MLYGKIKYEDSSYDPLNRIDSDTLLNYNINRYFKVFTGLKYMSYGWGDSDDGGKHSSYGPGLGISTVLPLGNSFYLLGNFSGILLWGKHKEDRVEEIGPVHWESDMTERGINTKISVAYYISSASTSVNLGFRYQYTKYVYEESNDQSDDGKYMFYGLTFSAVYSFEI